MHSLVHLEELDLVGLEQLNQAVHELLVVLIDHLVAGLGCLGHINWTADHQVHGLPAWDHSVAVLEEATADKFGGRNASHCLDKVLPTTQLGTWGICRLVEEVQFAKGEHGHQGSSVPQRELNESLSLLQHDPVDTGTHVERFLGTSDDNHNGIGGISILVLGAVLVV